MVHRIVFALLLVAAVAIPALVLADCCPCPIVQGKNPSVDKPPIEPKQDEFSEDKDKKNSTDKVSSTDLAPGEVVGLGNFVEEEEQQAVIG